MTKWKLERTHWDRCAFIGMGLIIGIHTDDLIYAGQAEAVDWFEEQLQKEFSIKLLGEPKLWCGVQVERISKLRTAINICPELA